MVKSIRLSIFISSGFLLSLAVLLLNDYYLKSSYSNWLTGKLSDVVGLFLFSLFWAALFSQRTRAVAVISGILFLMWKLPLSQPAIDFWNSISSIRIARVVDYSDLLALTVLPFSVRYFNSYRPVRVRQVLAVPVVVLSFFAILGTSVTRPYYAVKFELQSRAQSNMLETNQSAAEREAQAANEKIRSIAEQYGLKEWGKALPGYAKYYYGNGFSLSTDFDDVTRTLFVSVTASQRDGGDGDLYERTKVVHQIQDEIFAALDANFKNITVETETYKFDNEARITTLEIRERHRLWFFSKACGTDSSNSEIVRASQLIDKYFQSHWAETFPSNRVAGPAAFNCNSSLNRGFLIGRVTGVGGYSRAIGVSVNFFSGGASDQLIVEFTQRRPDQSVDVQKVVAELEGILIETLGETADVTVRRSK